MAGGLLNKGLTRRQWTAAAAGALASACQRAGKKRIAVIPKGTSHIFWTTVQAGALSAGRDLGVEVLWNGPALETEYSRQIQILDSMISQRVDGIAVAAAERKALVGSIDRAMAAGIPVTVFDSGIEGENYTCFVATNNVLGGELAAREMGKMIGGQGSVALVMHAPGSQSTMDREQGFEQAITKEFPGIKIVARQFGLSDRSKARAAAENILTAHPNLDGIFGSSEPSSVGAALAIKSRGLTERVRLVAFDSSDTMVDDLKNGAIDAMVVQDPVRMGFEAVKTVVDKLGGREVPKRIDLEPYVVHTFNMNRPEIRRLLNPDLSGTTRT